MIQDIFPYHFDNHYTPQPPEADSFILWYDSGQVLLKQERDTITFPRFSDLTQKERPNGFIYFPSAQNDFIGSTKGNVQQKRLFRCRVFMHCAD